VFSSGSINHLRYSTAPLVALHSVKPLCSPTHLGVLPDLLLENTTYYLLQKSCGSIKLCLCCAMIFFDFQDFVYASKRTNHDLLMDGVF